MSKHRQRLKYTELKKQHFCVIKNLTENLLILILFYNTKIIKDDIRFSFRLLI